MTREDLQELFPDDQLLFMDGYDDCVAGVAVQFNKVLGVVYDRVRVREKLMADGLSYEDAEEWMSFNQEGAWVGPLTPIFLHKVED